MLKSVILLTIIFAVTFTITGFAQPVKAKASKTAPAAKKPDYAKMKQDIRNLYINEKYAGVITKAAIYLAKFPKDTAVTFQKAVSHVSLKQNKIGFNLIRNLLGNADTTAKYSSFMIFGLPKKYLQTIGLVLAEEAIKIAPNAPFGYFAKGGILSDEGKHETALPLMEKMYTNLRNDEEKLFLGQYYPSELAFNKQYDKALRLIEDLHVKFKGDEEILISYASIYKMNKQYDKAVEKYDELIKISNNNLDHHMRKAQAFFEWGKTTDACTIAQEIIAKDNSYEFLGFNYKCPAYFAEPKIADIKTAVWDVNYYGQNYDFKVLNPTGSATADFEFDWIMTSGPNVNGHIKILKTAMEKANIQNNYFGAAMKDTTFSDRTTVWVSQAVIKNVLTNGAVKINVGDGEELFTIVLNTIENTDKEAFGDKIMFKGEYKHINTLHIKNVDGSKHLWILNDTNNPLIVKMQFEWGLSLKSID